MLSRSLVLKILLVFLLTSEVLSWRRRRRRRAPPPPPSPCLVSAWSAWGPCDKNCAIGSYTRHRSVTRYPAYGGAECPSLSQTEQCGEVNGGCEDYCQDGKCKCVKAGYELQDDQKSCGDVDECASGTSLCRNANCVNNQGSYSCTCRPGYQRTSNPHRCSPRSCSPLTIPQCPADAYNDTFGASCVRVIASCPDGLEFAKTCSLTCSHNYKLAIISPPSLGQKFAENFTTTDFTTPSDKTTCSWNGAAGTVTWDWDSQKLKYYCRRVNDPPMDIVLSNSEMNEREPFLTLVGNLTAADPQKDKLTFSIENTEGNNHFLIQGNQVLVKRVVVWSPSATAGVNTRTVVVKATDNGSPPMYSQTTLNVTIVNINDPPHDIELSKNDVNENVPTATVVGNLSAVDDDLGPQRASNFSWELLDSDWGYFSLLGNQVLVAKPLDHEKRNIHRIKVRCSDFGEPRQTSAVVIILINVRDKNDSPKSVNLTKNHVAENSANGTVVGNVEATDDDNDTLVFSLNASNPRSLAVFKLQYPTRCVFSSSSGKAMQTCSIALVVAGALDYEQENEYDIWVDVSDPGDVTRTKFKILVDDVNERPTDIILTNNLVQENSPGRTVVGEFVVSDPDNKNKPLQSHTCSLLNSFSGDEDHFLIENINKRHLLKVKPNSALNFELKNEYRFNVSCKDSHLDLTKAFIIEVTDVNESPTSLFLSNLIIKENSPNFTFVGNLSAKDPDGAEQSFVYTVETSSSAIFFIGGSDKNQLFVNGSIDFEQTPKIHVDIRVTDSGGLHFEKIFRITVKDMNDPPTGISLQDNRALRENSVEKTFIGGVSVVDEDSNTQALCILLNSSNDRVLLDGLSLLAGPTNTDYETLGPSKSLEILLNCSDGHGGSVTQWLKVPVQDVNEEPTSLALSNSQVQENENDSVVGVLSITDPDLNQRHECVILKNVGQNESLFYINNSFYPPELRTARPLDFESAREHTADIQCEDVVKGKGEATHVKEKSFVIRVLDVNEPPVIWCNTSFYVSPSFSRGSVVGQLEGYDPDNEEYYRSRQANPSGPYRTRKQLLVFRVEPENNSWPLDVTNDGIVSLEKQLKEEQYAAPLNISFYVEDDGTLLERVNGSDAYQITRGERRSSVHQCQIIVTSNLTDKDIHLSSNRIHENATNGTVIGILSRKPQSQEDAITYHLINNDSLPFEVSGNTMYVSSDDSLDYERLSPQKTLPVTISSRGSVSGVYTKMFLIHIVDVNEMPTAICLLRPQALEDCTVVGHILIEDPDHPELHCGVGGTVDVNDISSKLSEYTCHVQEGEDTLSNEINASRYFYVSQDALTLRANTAIFTREDHTYSVSVVCRSSLHALHVIPATLKVPITVPSHPECRHTELCNCPEPHFCLTHVKLAGRCVEKEYRINSTVAIPDNYFKKQGFVFTFEQYVASLIDRTSQGKTLKELMTQFDSQNTPVRRRRRETLPTFDNVYVELLVYNGAEKTTKVVFAAAQDFQLLLASQVCQLLKDSEVMCPLDNTTPNQNVGDESSSSGFPMWIVSVIIAGVLFLLIIIIISVFAMRRRQRNKRQDTGAVVRFARDGNTVNIDSMYETPVDDVAGESSNHWPVLVEKRRDIKVVDNPTYRSRSHGSHSERDEDHKQRTLNHYESEPEPEYETIDDDLYEKVNEERRQETKSNRKKSRSNPVYDMDDDDDDTLNPVGTLTISPAKKVLTQEKFDEQSEQSDDSWTTELISTFKTKQQDKTVEGSDTFAMVNPMYTATGKELGIESGHDLDDVFTPHDDTTEDAHRDDLSSC